MKNDLKIPKGEKCCICYELATLYCPFCVDEYDTYPRYVPTTFYCVKHYTSVVENGHCCYESEQIYGTYKSNAL